MCDQSIRVGVLQFTPYHGRPDLTKAKVEELCSSIVPGSLDLLVAPEMALTGYVFKDLQEIKPFCEEVTHATFTPTKYATIGLAQSLSQRLQCYTIMGFPEVFRSAASSPPSQGIVPASRPFDARPSSSTPSSSSPSFPSYYNSAILTSPNGTILHTFRKHFLFETDETWASPGPGFQFIDLPRPIGRLCVGICMDLNPFAFQTQWEKMELSTFCEDNQVETLVMPMAWLRGEVEGSQGEVEDGEEVNTNVVNYWAGRCEPLWKEREEVGRESRQTIFVTSNRTGTEGASTFAGSSSILRLEHGKQPELLSCLDETTQGLLLWDGWQGGRGR